MVGGILPLRTVGVAHVGWTFVPGAENSLCAFTALNDHEAGVGEGAIEAVVVRSGRSSWIERHGNRDFLIDLPVVEEPFDGKVHLVERCICVEEDDELVVVENVGYGTRFDPGVMSVGERYVL